MDPRPEHAPRKRVKSIFPFSALEKPEWDANVWSKEYTSPIALFKGYLWTILLMWVPSNRAENMVPICPPSHATRIEFLRLSASNRAREFVRTPALRLKQSSFEKAKTARFLRLFQWERTLKVMVSGLNKTGQFWNQCKTIPENRQFSGWVDFQISITRAISKV